MSVLKPIIKKDTNKHLLILVHGLNGSDTSWCGSERRFVENLIREKIIIENFDLSLFLYDTSISPLNKVKKITNLFYGFFWTRPKENIKGFNNGIGRISKDFETEIRLNSDKYSTISIIAHSMGGLITKSTLTWMSETLREKIRLFVSLSVPHLGSNLAKNAIVTLLPKNPQIVGLKAMGEFTTDLSHRFANLTPVPRIFYQTGNQDLVVHEISAVPPGIQNEFTIYTGDDHFSVLLIQDRATNTLFKKILQELNQVIQVVPPISVGVPEEVSFKIYLEIIAKKLGIQILFHGFTDEELNTTFREGNISALNFEDFLFQLSNFLLCPLRKFSVNNNKGTNIFIIKIENEK